MRRRLTAAGGFLFLAVAGACSSTGQPCSGGACDAGACLTLGTACTAGSVCCASLTCYSSACCASAGAMCSHSADCCSGACDAGVCACSGLGFGCGSSADCCQGQCLDGGTCGYYGTASIASSACNYTGLFDGGPLYQFNVALSGSASGPVNGGMTLFPDPANPIDTGAMSCGAWTANTGGYSCAPVAGQPANTRWSWSYDFATSSRSGMVAPYVTVDDPLANQLAQAQATTPCQ